MVDLSDLFVVFLFALFCWFIWQAIGVREIALRAVKRHCDEMDVQWLDNNVALRGLWLKRNKMGQLCFWRSYVFEFSSTGDERYQGRVILLGEQLESVQLEPHRLL